MSSKKRIVLASLLSVTMVLCFAMVFIPAHTRVGAAGDGSVSMADLLNLVLGRKNLTTVQITSPDQPRDMDGVAIDGQPASVRVNQGAADFPPLAITSATDGPADTTMVLYTGWASESGLETTTELTEWLTTAPDYPLPLAAAYEALGVSFAEALTQSLVIYANADDAALEKLAASEDVYDYIYLQIVESPFDLDPDDNGVPDDPFGLLGLGETYATVTPDGTVSAVVNLDTDDPTQPTTLSLMPDPDDPSRVVTVKLPPLQGLYDDETLGIPQGARIVLIVQLGEDLDAQFGGALAGAPEKGGRVPGAPYAVVSILVETPEEDPPFMQLTALPEGWLVELSMSGLDIADGASANFWSYSTAFGSAFTLFAPIDDEWDLRDEETAPPDANRMVAFLNHLTLLAPFAASMEVYEVAPPYTPINAGGTPADVTAGFLESLALENLASVAQIYSAYALYFGNVRVPIASFDQIDDDDLNLYLLATEAPDSAVPGAVDVTLHALDEGEPTGDYAVLRDGFTYVEVTVTPAAVNLITSQTYQLQAASTIYEAFDWESSDATVATVDDFGLVTAVGPGVAAITVTGADSGASAQASINVIDPVEVQVTVTPISERIEVGESVELTGASTVPEDINWQSSDPSVAIVDPTGLVVQVTGVGVGDAVITATGAMSGASAQATIEVVPVPVEFTVTQVTPEATWLFGGIVARVKGTGFDETVTVAFGSTMADIIAISEEAVDVIVPVLAGADETTPAEVVVPVTVNKDMAEPATIDFTYIHYVESAGTTTTAAILPTGSGTAKLSLAGAPPEAEFTLPAFDVGLPSKTNDTFVLARAAVNEAALGMTSAPASAFGDVWAFDLHLYKNLGYNTEELAFNTPGLPIMNTQTIYTEVKAQFAHDEDPATLAFPVGNAVAPLLTAAAVQAGAAGLYTIDSDFDYFQNVATPSADVAVPESTLRVGEAAVAGGLVTDVLQARMYNLSVHALRLRTDLADIPLTLDDLDLVDAQGNETTELSGPVSGGTSFGIESSIGMLGSPLTTVTMENGTKATVLATINNLGQDEFFLDLTAPAVGEEGVYNIVLNAVAAIDAQGNAVTKSITVGTFKFEADIPPRGGLLALIIGLLVALLGLLSGGSSSNGSGPCFIATAAYGTPLAAEIDTLRAVRDTYLLGNPVGTAFVDTYYRVSPAIADMIAQSPVLAAVVRMALLPVIGLAKLTLTMPMPSAVAATMAFMVALLAVRRRRGKA